MSKSCPSCPTIYRIINKPRTMIPKSFFISNYSLFQTIIIISTNIIKTIKGAKKYCIFLFYFFMLVYRFIVHVNFLIKQIFCPKFYIFIHERFSSITTTFSAIEHACTKTIRFITEFQSS